MRRSAALLVATGLPLSGCAIIEAILDALTDAVQEQPRFVYGVQEPNGFNPPEVTTLFAAFLTDEDTGLNFAELDTTLPPGTLSGLTLSPDAQRVGVTFFEEGFVDEYLFQIISLEANTLELLATDNTLVSSVEDLCGPVSATLAQAQADWPGFIEDGIVPPNTTPDIEYFSESPGNAAIFEGWLANDRIGVGLTIEVGLVEVDEDNNRVSYGPSASDDFDLELISDGMGNWTADACVADAGPYLSVTPERDLTIGNAGPDDGLILLDGVQLLNTAMTDPLNAGPVVALSGPVTPN